MELPTYHFNNVVYAVNDANLVVGWIHSYLFAQRQIHNAFLEMPSQEYKFIHFSIDYCSTTYVLSIELDFSIDG